MKRIILLFISVLTIGLSTTQAQENPRLKLYEKAVFKSKNGSLPYRILMPQNYNPNVQYPLVIFLHGSGERGTDNALQLKHGGELFVRDSVRAKYPAFVVFPQCAPDRTWSEMNYNPESKENRFTFSNKIEESKEQELLEELITYLQKNLSIRKSKIYIGGLSLGGIGTFELVRRNPKLFAAAFPICGAADPSIAKKLKHTNWWIFHGEDDDVVYAKYSIDMNEALTKVKASVKLSIYPEVMHDSWTNTFAEPTLLSWLFSQQL